MVKRTKLDADYVYKKGHQQSVRAAAMKRSQQIKINRLRLFVIVPLIILSLIFLVSNIRMYIDIKQTKQQVVEQQSTIEVLKKQQAQYNEVIESLNNEEFIEKLARQQYLLSNKGEIIFKLPNDENLIDNMIHQND